MGSPSVSPGTRLAGVANHLLFHFPHTPDEPLRKDYKRFPWVDDPVGLRAWLERTHWLSDR